MKKALFFGLVSLFSFHLVAEELVDLYGTLSKGSQPGIYYIISINDGEKVKIRFGDPASWDFAEENIVSMVNITGFQEENYINVFEYFREPTMGDSMGGFEGWFVGGYTLKIQEPLGDEMITLGNIVFPTDTTFFTESPDQPEPHRGTWTLNEDKMTFEDAEGTTVFLVSFDEIGTLKMDTLSFVNTLGEIQDISGFPTIYFFPSEY